LLQRDRRGLPELLVGEPYDQFAPAFSPDGRWIGYDNSSPNFGIETFVRPFPGGASAGKWRVSAGGGFFPVWSRGGKELLFFDHRGGRA
jgi:Tol biopolymer transport system component